MDAPQCPVCHTLTTNRAASEKEAIQCPRCGPYFITGSAVGSLLGAPLSLQQAANASGWLRDNPGHIINSHNLSALSETPTPTVSARADRLLLEIARRQQHIGEELSIQMHQGKPRDGGVDWRDFFSKPP